MSYAFFEPSENNSVTEDVWCTHILGTFTAKYLSYPLLAVNTAFYKAIQHRLSDIIFSTCDKTSKAFQIPFIEHLHLQIRTLKARKLPLFIPALQKALQLYVQGSDLDLKTRLKAMVILQTMACDNLDKLQKQYLVFLETEIKHKYSGFGINHYDTLDATFAAMIPVLAQDTIDAFSKTQLEQCLVPNLVSNKLSEEYDWNVINTFITEIIEHLSAAGKARLADKFYQFYDNSPLSRANTPTTLNCLAAVYPYLEPAKQALCLEKHQLLPDVKFLPDFLQANTHKTRFFNTLRKICLEDRQKNDKHNQAVALAARIPGILSAQEVTEILTEPDKVPLVKLLNKDQCLALIEPALACLEEYAHTHTEPSSLYWALPKLLKHLPNVKAFDTAKRLLPVLNTWLTPDDDYFDFEVALQALDTLRPKLSSAERFILAELVQIQHQNLDPTQDDPRLVQQLQNYLEELCVNTLEPFSADFNNCPGHIKTWLLSLRKPDIFPHDLIMHLHLLCLEAPLDETYKNKLQRCLLETIHRLEHSLENNQRESAFITMHNIQTLSKTEHARNFIEETNAKLFTDITENNHYNAYDTRLITYLNHVVDVSDGEKLRILQKRAEAITEMGIIARLSCLPNTPRFSPSNFAHSLLADFLQQFDDVLKPQEQAEPKSLVALENTATAARL